MSEPLDIEYYTFDMEGCFVALTLGEAVREYDDGQDNIFILVEGYKPQRFVPCVRMDVDGSIIDL